MRLSPPHFTAVMAMVCVAMLNRQRLVWASHTCQGWQGFSITHTRPLQRKDFKAALLSHRSRQDSSDLTEDA